MTSRKYRENTEILNDSERGFVECSNLYVQRLFSTLFGKCKLVSAADGAI